MWLDTQSINLFFYVQGHCVFFPLFSPQCFAPFFLDEKSFYTGRTVFSSVHTFVWINFVQVGIKSGGLKFDICISKHQNKNYGESVWAHLVVLWRSLLKHRLDCYLVTTEMKMIFFFPRTMLIHEHLRLFQICYCVIRPLLMCFLQMIVAINHKKKL